MSWAFDYYHAGMRRKSCISHFNEHMERLGRISIPSSFLGLSVSQSAKGPGEPVVCAGGSFLPIPLFSSRHHPSPHHTNAYTHATHTHWAHHNSLNLLEKDQCEVQKWSVSEFFAVLLTCYFFPSWPPSLTCILIGVQTSCAHCDAWKYVGNLVSPSSLCALISDSLFLIRSKFPPASRLCLADHLGALWSWWEWSIT